MLRIGITGGIGSGKSVVCRLFAVLGVPVYDSDARAKWVMAHDATLRQELTAAFGAAVFGPDGQLDRPYLARLAFQDPTRLTQLNGLVHPHVGRDFATWTAQQEQGGHAYVLKEAALLYESGAYRHLDRIITVFAPEAVRHTRVLHRDPHRTAQDVVDIMGKQLSEDEKLRRADFIVHNDDQQLVLPQVLELHRSLRELAGVPIE